VESAKTQAKMKKEIPDWGIADSIVYATGQTKKAEMVTGNEHFKKLKKCPLHKITPVWRKLFFRYYMLESRVRIFEKVGFLTFR